MRCDELRRLLSIYGDESDISSDLIATHIRDCPTCALGIAQLSDVLIANDTLSCDECRARFPAYYDATHPEYRLTVMPDSEMAEVAVHLGHCDSCRDQYEIMVLLSKMEAEDAV